MQIARHPKDCQIHALLTAEDARLLHEAAQREDVPISQLVRRCIRQSLGGQRQEEHASREEGA